MKKIYKKIVYPSFERYLTHQMKDETFKKAYEEEGRRLEIAYQILQLRNKQRLSQKTLAEKLDTTQSVIARMEAGKQNFSIDTLGKIASVLKRELKIEFTR